MKFLVVYCWFVATAFAQDLVKVKLNNYFVKSAEISFQSPVLNLDVSLIKSTITNGCFPHLTITTSEGLTANTCELNFLNTPSRALTVRLDYAFVSTTDREDLFVLFESSCGGEQKFIIKRKVNRRYKCSSNGDPHITPFDNKKSFTFSGRGPFYLVRPVGSLKPTEVIAWQEHCGGYTSVTCNKAIAIRHLNSFIVIKIKNNRIERRIGGKDIAVTTKNKDPNSLLIKLTDESTIAVNLLFWRTPKTPYGDPYLNVDLDFIFEYTKKITGLCGNLDGVEERIRWPEYFRVPNSVASQMFNQFRFTFSNTRLFSNTFRCVEDCEPLEIQKRDVEAVVSSLVVPNVEVTITGSLTNTGNCDTSIPDSLLISTGNAEVDNKLNDDRLGVKDVRENCKFDAEVTGDAQGTVTGYLKSLQATASEELALLVKALLPENDVIIAQLSEKYKLNYTIK